MTTITPLALPEVLLITPKRHGDARGWFSETWSRPALAAAGLDLDFVQDNQAFSAARGTLRGLHFQKAPYAQAKLVRVLRGAIYDVAVDIRPGSATYGRWIGAELSAERGDQLLVPRGFAHGYVTLVPDTELFYKVDNRYAPEAEGGLLWRDPALAVDWPVAEAEITANPRDRALPTLAELGRVAF
ncbi:dTDP-4-dehydrorhamnose 3,5-epimerase [Phenylobacterium sp.]|jgi:dTDP-4-dehydrorhamnose 3,5-epimerase|uniref:dTDP-4-dehydrorhamnose 3,5-epimerase n=1 Tax=Phenylobacterium sp. TaxID=1871053 RepID=UPI002F3F55BE